MAFSKKEEQPIGQFLDNLQKGLLPTSSSGNTRFQEILEDTLFYYTNMEGKKGTIAHRVLLEWSRKHILPLYEFFTSPRSIEQFLFLRKGTSGYITESLVKAGGHDEFVEDIVMSIAAKLWVIPSPFYGSQIIREVEVPFFYSQKPRLKNRLSPDKKICQGVEEAKKKIDSLRKRQSDGPVGLASGKWRIGVHSGHRSLLQNAGKVLSPVGGILTVSVETNEAIQARRNQEAPPLEERMGWVAAQPWVDIVFPVDPQATNEADRRKYYEMIWQTLGVNFYFLGEKDHEYFPLFAEGAKKLGAILLWDRESGKVSASEMAETLK